MADACQHLNFAVESEINRIVADDNDPNSELIGLTADIKAMCMDCGERMQWIGPGLGVSASRPTVSVDGTELRIPIRPESAPVTFGTRLPGFAVTFWQQDGLN